MNDIENKSLINESVEKNRLYEIENPGDTNKIALFGRALSSPIRIEILRLLNRKPRLLSEISNELGLQLSSTAFHMRVLEDANLVNVEYSTKKKSSLKWYSYNAAKNIVLRMRSLFGTNNLPKQYVAVINIGDYVDAQFGESCGFASEKELLMENMPHAIFAKSRHNAQILWCRDSGFVCYALANEYAQEREISSISFSLEICAETNGFNTNFPSDITFEVNGTELCTWRCPGDFGDRYGKFTPDWWFSESTKYGLLVNLSVKKSGVYLNEHLVNKHIKVSDLHLTEGNRTTFCIRVKKDAEHVGGFNIFGEKFGDHAQAIVFTVIYDPTHEQPDR